MTPWLYSYIVMVSAITRSAGNLMYPAFPAHTREVQVHQFMQLLAPSLRRTCTKKGLEASPTLSGALDILHAQLTGPDSRLGTDR